MKLQDFDFRIWDRGEETLIYASKDWKLSIGFSNPQQDNGETESVLHAYYDGEPQCPDDCEIELWVGSKDKNGVKIYENDIVKFDDDKTYQIVFGDFFDGFSIWAIDGESIRVMTSSYFLNACEVIGNIHENADDLNQADTKQRSRI